MRIGVSLTSAHQVEDVREGARWMIERAAAARMAGLDSLFIGDHHSTPAPYYQNAPMMGRLLAEWGDNPAGILVLLPLWNPVLVAEQTATLASIHGGRFVLQCAVGGDRRQFEAMGVNIHYRPSLFEESLDMIRRLWAGEVVSGSNRYHIREARIGPKPPEPIDVWIGGSSEAAVDRAARLGDAYLGGPELTPEQARHWSTFYADRCRFYGRAPSAIALRRDVYAGEGSGEGADVGDAAVQAGYRGIDRSALVYGSIDEVAASFKEYAAMGYTDIIIRHLTNDQAKVLGSMKRLGEVREAIASV